MAEAISGAIVDDGGGGEQGDDEDDVASPPAADLPSSRASSPMMLSESLAPEKLRKAAVEESDIDTDTEIEQLTRKCKNFHSGSRVGSVGDEGWGRVEE